MQNQRQHSGPKRGLLVIASIGGILLLTLLFYKTDGSKKSFKLEEVELKSEGELLFQACEKLRNTDDHLGSGGFKFLGSKRTSLEDLIVTSKVHACLAANKTKIVFDKIMRLEKNTLNKNFIEEGQWEILLPILLDIESHLEVRYNSIEELKVSTKMINDLIPSSMDNLKDFSEATSIVRNFYICAEFIFTEIPNVYKLFFDVEDGDSTTLQVFSFMMKTAFKLGLIGIIWIIAPKTIWKLHLFVMKVFIIFFCMVLCVGFYNYFSSFILNLQHHGLRSVIDQDIAMIESVKFSKNIWSLPHFKTSKDIKMIGTINGKMQQNKYTRKERHQLRKEFLSDNEKFLENLDKKVSVLENSVENNKYRSFLLDVKITLEKFAPVLKNFLDFVDQSIDLYSNLQEKYEGTLNQTDSYSSLIALISYLNDCEEETNSFRSKILSQVKKINKIENEVLLLEESNQQMAKRAGTLSTLIGVASYPYLRFSSNTAGFISASGLAGTIYAYSMSRSWNSQIALAKELAFGHKQISKEILSLLGTMDPMKAKLSLVALNEVLLSGNENSSKFYIDELKWMMMDNMEEIAQIIQRKLSILETLISY